MFGHNHEAVPTLSPMPGQAALREREWLLHPGRHCPGRGLLRLSLHRRAAGRCRCVSIIAGPSVIRKLARHMTLASLPSLIYDRYLRSCAGLLRRGAAASCCGGVLEVRVGCTSSQDTRHKLVASHLVWHHSVMRAVISLRFTRVLRCVS